MRPTPCFKFFYILGAHGGRIGDPWGGPGGRECLGRLSGGSVARSGASQGALGGRRRPWGVLMGARGRPFGGLGGLGGALGDPSESLRRPLGTPGGPHGAHIGPS